MLILLNIDLVCVAYSYRNTILVRKSYTFKINQQHYTFHLSFYSYPAADTGI
jgi:hypothetical protein